MLCVTLAARKTFPGSGGSVPGVTTLTFVLRATTPESTRWTISFGVLTVKRTIEKGMLWPKVFWCSFICSLHVCAHSVVLPTRESSQKICAKGFFANAMVVRGHDWLWGDQDGKK